MRIVYGLYSEADNLVRYVGQTGAKLTHRLKSHIHAARRRPGAFSEWLLAEHAAGRLRSVILAETADADRVERLQIARFSQAAPLFNARRGGRDRRPARLLRPIAVMTDDNGALLITCPEMPEVTTFAETPRDLVARANDAIEEALAARGELSLV